MQPPVLIKNRSSYKRLAEIIDAQGFALIETPREITKIISTIFAVAPTFFNQSPARKMEDGFCNLASGYRGIGTEFSISNQRYDLLESFSYLAVEEPIVRSGLSDSAMILYNLLKKYTSSLERLIDRVISNLARVYGAETKQLDLFSTRYSPTQINYYEPYQYRRRVLVDPHEDGVLLTALVADCPGLEILGLRGECTPIECSCNTTVLMAGELLALLTGYSISPIRHRVRRYSNQKSRLSLVHFANVNIDTPVFPWLVNDQNRNIDIVAKAINNPTRFGLPPLNRQ